MILTIHTATESSVACWRLLHSSRRETVLRRVQFAFNILLEVSQHFTADCHTGQLNDMPDLRKPKLENLESPKDGSHATIMIIFMFI